MYEDNSNRTETTTKRPLEQNNLRLPKASNTLVVCSILSKSTNPKPRVSPVAYQQKIKRPNTIQDRTGQDKKNQTCVVSDDKKKTPKLPNAQTTHFVHHNTRVSRSKRSQCIHDLCSFLASLVSCRESYHEKRKKRTEKGTYHLICYMWS